ncbi:MAG: hypothetical protein WC968_02165 [Bacilli bacterium]
MKRKNRRPYLTLACSLFIIKLSIPQQIERNRAMALYDLVISEVYTRGGRSGALYIDNYVTIYNPSNDIQNVDGLALQYFSGSGNFQVTTLSGVILPKSHYLVSFKPVIASQGLALPLPDVVSTTMSDRYDLHMALTEGSGPLDYSNLELHRIIDYVGIGNVNTIYGNPASNPNAGNIAIKRREVDGEINTSKIDNREDFILGEATPLNSYLSVANYILKEEVEGQCAFKYPHAKMMISALSRTTYDERGGKVMKGQYEAYLASTDPNVVAARLRYEAWAKANGDYGPYSLPTKEQSVLIKEKRRTPFVVVLLIISSIMLYVYQRLKQQSSY